MAKLEDLEGIHRGKRRQKEPKNTRNKKSKLVEGSQTCVLGGKGA